MYLISYNNKDLDDKKHILRIDGTVNRFTWFTTWNYALRCYYNDNIDYVPQPIKNSDFNCNVEFRSKQPCIATVDWGDGVVEQFPLVKPRGQSYYRIIFRSLNVEYRKNPDSHPWWFYKEDGSEYIPIPPHNYKDGRKDIERHVVVEFSSDIYYANVATTHMTQFPLVEIPSLTDFLIEYTKGISDFPEEKLAKSPNLARLRVKYLGKVKLPYISDAIMNKTELTSLEIVGTYDFSNIETSNIRKINKLKKLQTLDVSDTELESFIKEFNDLPLLKTLRMNLSHDTLEELNKQPYFDEVDKINQSITVLDFCTGWQNGSARTEWPNGINGKGVENLTSLSAFQQRNIRVDSLPDFFREMRSLTSFDFYDALRTQDRVDTFVNTFYDYVINWEQISMSKTARDNKRNQFYNLSVIIYSKVYPYDKRPSGVEQAPVGFVLGSSNGTPQTPMEKIYVLKNNYKQKWTIAPE